MKYFRFSKLVRDAIPEQMRSGGQDVRGLRTLSDEEYIHELQRKVVEEAAELGHAQNVDELKEELADAQEVLDCLKMALGMTTEEVSAYQQKKVAKNGGFASRLYIESVGAAEDNQWYDYYVANPDKYPEVK